MYIVGSEVKRAKKYMIANCTTSEVYETNYRKLREDMKSSLKMTDLEVDSLLDKATEGDPANFQHNGTWYDTWVETDFSDR